MSVARGNPRRVQPSQHCCNFTNMNKLQLAVEHRRAHIGARRIFEEEIAVVKWSLPVLALVAALGLSAPALAGSVASCQSTKVLGPNGVLIDSIDANADGIAMELRQMGYNVESVQGWGGCVKAFITDPGGGSHMAFFDPDTLEPLTTN
jgi:hypothetical protein